MELSKEELLATFNYKDGELYWKSARKGIKAGDKAGYINNGYVQIKLNGKDYRAHRLIFLMHNGWLPEFIDHIDTNRSNNRIENLRAATKAQNGHNFGVSTHNKSGYRNVYWSDKDNRWRVHLRCNGKRISCGSFTKLIDAVEAAQDARSKYHGEFAFNSDREKNK